MKDLRRRYSCQLIVNQRMIHEIVIDPHYEIKHSRSINDDLILKLVHALHGGDHALDRKRAHFSYFVKELEWNNRFYRLVWVLEDGHSYLGVINAHRR